ncbi:MAG: aminopeptidase P family protein [Phycisphaerae bacterium]|nr:aminopeptidase P family protein [Phycisphaerae bacterium]
MISMRHERLSQAMVQAGLDALFISNPKNVLYLSGFHATMPGEVQSVGDPEAFVLAYRGEIHLLCDGRYIAGAGELNGITPHRIESPTTPKIIADELLRILGPATKVLGYEPDALIHSDAVALLACLGTLECRPAGDIMTGLRMIKTAQEIAELRQAQAITGACFEHVAGRIRVGMSERDVAFEIDTYLRKHSEGNSFSPIVAFGETSARPHYSPNSNRKLESGHLVLLDFGAVHHGYCGDLTRMLVMGKASSRHREVYDLVLKAQLRCLAGIKPGMSWQDIDALCRDYFRDHGCADAFMHGTGHGVGLAIHEPPRLKQTFQEKIAPGMVFTIEPGLYFVGWGGVRIEDMVVATQTGIENLTTTSKELLEVV